MKALSRALGRHAKRVGARQAQSAAKKTAQGAGGYPSTWRSYYLPLPELEKWLKAQLPKDKFPIFPGFDIIIVNDYLWFKTPEPLSQAQIDDLHCLEEGLRGSHPDFAFWVEVAKRSAQRNVDQEETGQ